MTRIALVLVPGVHLLDLAGPAQAFSTAADHGYDYRLSYLAEQTGGFVGVLRHTAAFLVEGGERILRFRVAGVGGDTQQFGGALQILRQRLSVEIEQRQIIGRLGTAELGRGGQELDGLFAVGGAAGECAGRASRLRERIAL